MEHPILVDETGEVGKAYGATNTPHGIPAELSCRIASSLRSGDGARGSILREISASSGLMTDWAGIETVDARGAYATIAWMNRF